MNTASRHSKTTARSSAGRADIRRISPSLSSGVVDIFSTGSAFAALKDDGSVVTWGHYSKGGDSSAVASSLSSGVVHIFGGKDAFAALKDDGSVITWGSYYSGGDSSAVASSLSSGVVGFANPFINDVYNSPPGFLSAVTTTDGTKVVLTYNQPLSSTTAAASAFTVTTDGSTNTVTAVEVDGDTVALTLNDTVKNDQEVIVTYTDPPQEMTPTPFKTKLAKTPHR